MERGAEAVEETVAEEGEVAVAAEGVDGAFGCLGCAHRGQGCWNAGWRGGSWRGGNGGAGRWLAEAAQPPALHAARAGCWRTRFGPGQQGHGRAGRPVRQQHE